MQMEIINCSGYVSYQTYVSKAGKKNCFRNINMHLNYPKLVSNFHLHKKVGMFYKLAVSMVMLHFLESTASGFENSEYML